jgi:Mce-associated membrane protein
LSPDPSRPGHAVDERETAHALALAEADEAEADAAVAEALATAARARARALKLRRDAETDSPEQVDAEGDFDQPSADAAEEATREDLPGKDESAREPIATGPRRLRWRRPRPRVVATAAAVLVACAMVGASGFILWQHREAGAEQQRAAEFAAAARQGIVTLMSMDFAHAKDDVQRVIDNSTGSFKDDFVKQAADYTATVQQSQVTTVTTVNAVAVKSMAADSADVLVGATSEVTNAAGAKQEPRAWRLAVTVTRDGDQLKLSKVEFVP